MRHAGAVGRSGGSRGRVGAAGRYGAYYEYVLNAWDWAAGEMLCGAVGLETRHLDALPGTGAGLLVAAPGIVDALEAIVTG